MFIFWLFRSHDTKAVPLQDDSLVVLVTNSKVEHSHSSAGAVDKDSEYNERRKSCERAASCLGAASLRDVTMATLEGGSATNSLHLLCVYTPGVVSDVDEVKICVNSL